MQVSTDLDIGEVAVLFEDEYLPTQVTFPSGAMMLTSLSSELANRLLTDYKTTGNGRLSKNTEGSIELINSLWVDYGDTHTDLHDINELLRIKDRIVSLCGDNKTCYESTVILDWGCGAGHTLMQLDRWLKKERIFGVKLYGFANEIHPDWQYASENMTFILDVAENLPMYFKRRSVDFIYSIAGLYYLFLPQINGGEHDMVEYFNRHQFNNQLFQSYAHTEKYLEQLSLLMKYEAELLIDLPIHVIDIDYNLLKTQNKRFVSFMDPAKYGEHGLVVMPNLPNAA